MPRKKKSEVEAEKKEEVKEEKASEDSSEKAQAVETKKEESSLLEEPSLEKKPREENEKTSERKENTEEFPEIELGIDIFSQAKTETEGKKVEETKETEKLKELKEKAKKLAEKIEEKPIKLEDLERELKEKAKTKRAEKTLFPLDDYVKYSAHLGTKAVTPLMRQYVYKRRADGLAVLNTNFIDEKLKEAIEFLKNFKPEDIFLACKREAGWKAAKKFSEVTGIRVFTKKYPAGVITNLKLPDFFEAELIIVCDPWLDKNALHDAVKIKKPVIALCDTNNLTTGTTKIIPCNNKAEKPLGLILYLIAREYLKTQGQEKEAKELRVEDFAGKVEDAPERREERKTRTERGAKEGV